MKRIIFVCHGNICRSPAAEWIMKNLVQKYKLEDKFFIYSRATSTEEIGNDIYPPMKRELINRSIMFSEHRAMQINQNDYDNADYIFYMDKSNLLYLNHLFNDKYEKIEKITKYTKNLEDIEDPWYSGQYEKVCNQITICCENIIKNLLRK